MAHRAGFFRQRNQPDVKIGQRREISGTQTEGAACGVSVGQNRRRIFSGRQFPHQHRCDSEDVEQLAMAIALFGCIDVPRPKGDATPVI